mgnify:CR=1 FL=1
MKGIISVIGKDKTGIIAKVSTALYEMKINIEDISQTIMQDSFFTMVMVVDISKVDIKDVDEKLQEIAKEMRVDIAIRNEDIFNKMHRI